MRKMTEEQAQRIEELRAQLADAALAYNGARQDLMDAVEEVREAAESYYNDRSESWQDGDTGAAYMEWMEALQEEPSDECSEDVAEYPCEPEWV